MHNRASPAPAIGAIHSPGTEGLWTFVFIDMMIFLLIFVTFMGERLRQAVLYTASQLQLNEVFGLANTLILLTSSWMVVEATRSARRQRVEEVSRYLGLAFLLGAAFSLSKLLEYSLKLRVGITPASNPFFSFYFFITVVHFLHVLAGMVFLFHFRMRARVGVGSAKYVAGLENVGLFWHYVDVLWIFIFPLLYLVGRQ
jgi:nitric oxide reductase NorE protein